VEDYHFSSRVESLISGQSSSIGGDLDYTLRAFPNHHRALVAMLNLGARTKVGDPPGVEFTVECYFKRAVQFRPDDAVARMLYVKYLGSNGRKPEALKQLDFVVEHAADNAFTHYNAGLLYLELAQFDRALAQAHKALELGFTRPDLRDKLKAAGKWVEPAEPAAAASAPEKSASR
jgi:tetratricopeptide (TPR) repeat protein